MCPELGNLTRRQIASLVGVAPHPKESGKVSEYKRGKRSQVKRALFMAVLSAKSYNQVLKKIQNMVDDGDWVFFNFKQHFAIYT
jgi:hypothetical protein